MFRHNIGDILKHLQREHVQIGLLLGAVTDRFLQSPQVFIDIPVELHPVDAGNGGGRLERLEKLIAVTRKYTRIEELTPDVGIVNIPTVEEMEEHAKQRTKQTA